MSKTDYKYWNRPTLLRNKYDGALCQTCGGIIPLNSVIAYDGSAHHKKCHVWYDRYLVTEIIKSTHVYSSLTQEQLSVVDSLIDEIEKGQT